MSVKNPKEFWEKISDTHNWRDYILPKRSDEAFDEEGHQEAERMYYLFDNNDTVIDYGCGIGRVAKYVAERCDKVIGLDINPDFISKAKEYVTNEKITFSVSDEFHESECADFVYALMVFQHNDSVNRQKMIEQIHRLLKPGKKALIQFPNIESNYYQESSFVHKFTREEVENYGKLFLSYEIKVGNLVNYASKFDRTKNHEYFLLVTK